jgi:hypothetical protein
MSWQILLRDSRVEEAKRTRRRRGRPPSPGKPAHLNTVPRRVRLFCLQSYSPGSQIRTRPNPPKTTPPLRFGGLRNSHRSSNHWLEHRVQLEPEWTNATRNPVTRMRSCDNLWPLGGTLSSHSPDWPATNRSNSAGIRQSRSGPRRRRRRSRRQCGHQNRASMCIPGTVERK